MNESNVRIKQLSCFYYFLIS